MLLTYEELAVAMCHDGGITLQDLEDRVPMFGDIETSMHAKGLLRATGYDSEGYLCYVLTHEGFCAYRDTKDAWRKAIELLEPRRRSIWDRIASWFA